MKTLALLFALLIPLACGPETQASYFFAKASVGGATYLINQNFEGAGYDNGETWTETGTGTLDEDYATAPAPLVGSQSFRIAKTGQTGRVVSVLPSDQSTCWGYFQINFTSSPANGTIWFSVLDVSATIVLSIEINTGSIIRVRSGSANASTVSTVTTATTYHFWWKYVKGTGANAVAQVAFQTSGTEPLSGNNFAQVTTGTATTDANNIRIGNTGSSTYEFIVDRVLVDDADIGDNP